MKRFFSLVLVLALAIASATAEPVWPKETEGQRFLAELVQRLNENLKAAGEQSVNTLFAAFKGSADFAITDQPDAEIPEGVEFHAELHGTSVNQIVLRVNDPDRFVTVAGCLLKASSPELFIDSDPFSVPKSKVSAAKKEPDDSFQEPVTDLNGTSIYSYYAYFPNQYRDGVNWFQLTLVFPLEGYMDESGRILNPTEETRAPDTYSGNNEDYDGYFSADDYSHLDIFPQATPEPDSAAAEQMNR